MTVAAMARRIDAADTAKMARKMLKAAWPTVTFKVHTSRFSGGSSVDVTWEDGPTRRAVERLVGHMKGQSFDAMTDYSSYHDTIHEGELVFFSNGYMSCQRDVSPALRQMIVDRVNARYGLNIEVAVNTTKYGTYYKIANDETLHNFNCRKSELVYREFDRYDAVTGELEERA